MCVSRSRSRGVARITSTLSAASLEQLPCLNLPGRRECRLPAAAKPKPSPGRLDPSQDVNRDGLPGGREEEDQRSREEEQRVAARAWEWRGCDPIPDNILIALRSCDQALPAAQGHSSGRRQDVPGPKTLMLGRSPVFLDLAHWRHCHYKPCMRLPGRPFSTAASRQTFMC